MKFEAVVFDLDGTLLNTIDDLADSMNSVLASFGFPVHATEAYYYFVGEGMGKLVRRALPEKHKDESMVSQALVALKEEYDKRLMVKTVPYEGIPELLDSLTNMGIKLAVLSNKPDQYTKLLVKELLPRWQFELVLGARENVPRKPDPTGALEIVGKLNINPDKFLYMGDTSIDMKTACAAKLYPVGVLWGFRKADELIQSGAKKLINNPMELLELL